MVLCFVVLKLDFSGPLINLTFEFLANSLSSTFLSVLSSSTSFSYSFLIHLPLLLNFLFFITLFNFFSFLLLFLLFLLLLLHVFYLFGFLFDLRLTFYIKQNSRYVYENAHDESHLYYWWPLKNKCAFF